MFYKGKRDNEFFAGNTNNGIPEDARHLPGIRLGEVAYDIDGKPLPNTWRPLFVPNAQADAYDRIRMAAFNAIRGS